MLKYDIAESFYHVYARGASRQKIFHHADDFAVFLNLFKRYLSQEPVTDSAKRPYPHLRNQIELLAYCLMGNHFHLLLYQVEEKAMSTLMRGVMTSYSRYFNQKYQRSGPLFESRYKASLITTDMYLQHISRYIHLNPKDWRAYPYSSVFSYLGQRNEEWLQPQRVLELFTSREDYAQFMANYEDNKQALDELKHQLANTY